MKLRRTISWLAAFTALITLAALTVVSTTCGGGGRSKTPGVPPAPVLEAGTTEWIHTWSGSEYDIASATAVDDSGNIYVAGNTRALGAGGDDALLLKYDSDGSLLWQKTWGGSDTDCGNALAVDTSGDVYMTGVTESFGAGDNDVLLLKYSPNGNLLWQRIWAGSDTYTFNYARAVDVDFNEGVYVAGATAKSDGRNSKALLLKYSSDGALLWEKTWGGSTGQYEYAVQVSVDRDVCVAGVTRSFGAGDRDALFLKYSSDGNLLLAKTWGGPEIELVYGAAVDSKGDFYITGSSKSFNAWRTAGFLLKYSSSGDLLWQRSWRWSDSDYVDALAVDRSGNVYVAGKLWSEKVTAEASFGPGRLRIDAQKGSLLLKCSAYGDLLWRRVWLSARRVWPSDYGTDFKNIALDGSGKIILVGSSSNTFGIWQNASGSLSSPIGVETTPEGIESTPEGTETIPEGVETEPVGVIDEGGGDVDALIMKYDPL